MKKTTKGRQKLRSLVLNATYAPLCLVSSRRAVILVLTNKAEAIHENDIVWHSASRSVALPSVIRLLSYVKVPYKAKVPLTRRAVLTRDGYRCQYCGDIADTIDHLIPRSKGGAHSWENLVAACRPCNHKKSDRSLKDLGWTVKKKPVAPTGTMWMIVGVAVNEDWKPYLGAALPVAVA